MWPSTFALLVLCVARTSLADSTNMFFVPSTPGFHNFNDNEVWVVGDTHSIEWATTNTTYNVSFWQQDLTQGSAHLWSDVWTANGDGAGNHSFDWKVQLYGADLSHSNVFFFWVESDDHKTAIETSAYFNITNRPIAGSSSSTSTTPATPSATSNPTSIPVAATGATTGSPTPTSSPSSSDNNPNNHYYINLGIGLGVGITFGVLILAGIAFIYYRKHRKSKQAKNAFNHSPPMHHEVAYYQPNPNEPPIPYYTDPKATPHTPAEQRLFSHELPPDSHAVYEAPGSSSGQAPVELPGQK